jgi:hypothetical protein
LVALDLSGGVVEADLRFGGAYHSVVWSGNNGEIVEVIGVDVEEQLVKASIALIANKHSTKRHGGRGSTPSSGTSHVIQ